MDDIVERMRALVAQDEADAEHLRALRLRRSWFWWLRRIPAPAVH